MFFTISGRHVGGPKIITSMEAPYWALLINAKHFDEYLKFGKKRDLKLGEVLP